MNRAELFPIGDVARLFHISVSSLRHYEKLGLLQPVQIASPNGHLCHIRRTARDIISGQTGTH